MNDCIQITPYLSYFPAQETPLSADIFVIQGRERLYLYDTGYGEKALRFLHSLPQPAAVILSHFHADHAGNAVVPCDELLVSNRTRQKIGIGSIVDAERVIEDGITLRIARCPSVHEKGSLIVTVNGEYTLVGDLWYARQPLNRSVAMEMLSVLRSIDTKYFVVSHAENKLYEKQQAITGIKAQIAACE